MAPKRATFISYGNDDTCAETRRFIENAGIVLEVRDLLKHPFTEDEVFRLIGNWDIQMFLNPVSEAYHKLKLDEQMPARHEIIKLIASDPTLLRRPIIRNARLMTIGCDRRRIAEMLQISMNGKGNDEEANSNGNNQQPRQQSSTVTP
jgi:arsenate reductase-like glutaredoxin family protein